jgi:hypothetical protein
MLPPYDRSAVGDSCEGMSVIARAPLSTAITFTPMRATVEPEAKMEFVARVAS